MINIIRKKTITSEMNLKEDEAKEVVQKYLEKYIIGTGCYFNKDGSFEHWTSYPHGSGTTTTITPSLIQIKANELLKLLKEFE